MSYIDQCNDFIRKQSGLTPKELERIREAWMEGYLTCTSNWCRGKR